MNRPPPDLVPPKNRSFAVRLGFAAAGLRTVARREKSFRTQLMLAAGAGTALVVLRPGLVWAALVLLSTGLVLALEAVNAALEYALDRLHPEHAEEIGHTKDAAAGGVLVASLAAAAIGFLMLLSVIWR